MPHYDERTKLNGDRVIDFTFTDWRGKRVTRTYHGTRKQAESVAVAMELEHYHMRHGMLPVPSSDLRHRADSFKDVVAEYLAWGRAQGGHGGRPWAASHARRRATTLAFWQERLGLDVLGDLTGCLPGVERVLRELQAKGLKGRTLAAYAEGLKSMCGWCINKSRRYLAEDPLAGLAEFDVTPQRVRRALTSDEIGRLLDKAPERRRLLYQTALCSGLRVNELRSLVVGDVDVEHRRLRLHSSWTKARKDGYQVLPAMLVHRLAASVKGRGPEARLLHVPTHAERGFKSDLAKADIPISTFMGVVDLHSLRVTYITGLTEANVNAKELMTLARHSDPKMTLGTYAKMRGDARLSEIAEQVGAALIGRDDGPRADNERMKMAAGSEAHTPQAVYVEAAYDSNPLAPTINIKAFVDTRERTSSS